MSPFTYMFIATDCAVNIYTCTLNVFSLQKFKKKKKQIILKFTKILTGLDLMLPVMLVAICYTNVLYCLIALG